MKKSRFIRALYVLFLSLAFLQVGQSQATIDTVTCLCSDEGLRAKDSITISTGGEGPWWLVDYSGRTIWPDSLLWHAASLDISEGYFLTDDADLKYLDTLILQDRGVDTIFTLVTYRDPSVGFNFIKITNGTDTLETSYPVCAPANEGLMGSDTICLGDAEMYSLSGIVEADLDTATWTISPAITGSGSTFYGFSNIFRFSDPGTYIINIEGRTIKDCDFSITDSVYVVNNIYPIVGPSFACAGGDTALYNISGGIIADYDIISWEILDAAGSFVGDSTDVDAVMVAWTSGPDTARIVYNASSTSHSCTSTDTISVVIANVLEADVTGETLFCINDVGSFKSFINNLDTILWTTASSTNTIMGDPRADSIEVIFAEAGLDTIFIEGLTLMGCPVFDTIVVDVKDSDIMLMGAIGMCIGDTVTYSARYSDGTLADFSSITWQVTPIMGADTMLFRSSPTGPYDTLKVIWTEVGNYQIIVNGMSGDACMLSDTIDVVVQDTSFVILGPDLVCYSPDDIINTAEFRVVQSHDSMDVVTQPVFWQVFRGSTKEKEVTSNDTLIHGFHLGTFANPNVKYRVMATGSTPYGCQFVEFKDVEVFGRNDLKIEGPGELCAGSRDTVFYVNIPDSLFDGPAVWDVRYNDGTQLSPGFWTGIGDSLTINFPNEQDTFNISLMATIKGADCDPVISTKQVILTDMISFVDQSNQPYPINPGYDTLCLTSEAVVFALNVDSVDIDFNSDFLFQLFDADSGANLDSDLPWTSSGSRMATTINWPSAGNFRITVEGYTLEDCRIDEELIVTVKDSNYIITGDPQICFGDTLEYVFLQGWNNLPVDSLNSDTVTWSLISPGTGSGISYFQSFGYHKDTLRVVYDTIGNFTIKADAITECDCEVDAEFDVIVRSTDFLVLGPDSICNGTTGIYYAANADSSRIIDLIPDSTTWSLASGGEFSGADADSIIINWNKAGVFTNVLDTLYFSGMTDDGCEVIDTLPIVINTNDYILYGNGAVCEGNSILLRLVNQADSSAIAGLDSVVWIVDATDTIITYGTGDLTKLDEAGTITEWPTGGVYNVQATGTTAHGCLIVESFEVTVYEIKDAMIYGDLNTCLGTPQKPTEPDVYTLNIPDVEITNVVWEIVALGHITGTLTDFPQPDHNGLTGTTLTINEWNSAGWVDADKPDYKITVSGTTLGGCEFSDEVNIIIIPTEDAFSMICNNNLNITLPVSCELKLTPDMILEDWESYAIDESQFEIRIKDPETGAMLSENGTVDESFMGKTVQIEVLHECSGQSCWGFVLLEDKNIPDLICGSDTIACDGSIDPRNLNFSPYRIDGYPVPDTIGATVTRISGQSNSYVVRGFELCGDATLKYYDRIETNICSGDFGTIIYRDWTMTNHAGKTSTCTDTINIERLHIDTFINMFADQLDDKSFECGDNISGFANPTFNLDEYCFNIQWTATETKSLLCNNNENTYVTTKTWTILDWCGGVVRNLSQTITVDDNTSPTVNLRGGTITTEASEDYCFGEIVLNTTDVIISDNCTDISTVRVRIFEDNVTGQLLEERDYIGNFTSLTISDPNILLDLNKIFISVEAYDECGNFGSDTISRMIIINDDVMPNAVCDEEVVINLNDEGWGLIGYQAFDRGSNDNCGPVEVCITRMDDLDIFEGLDTNNDDVVNYSDFLAEIADAGREGTNYSEKTTFNGSVEVIHKDSLCTNRLKFECVDAMASFLGEGVMVQMTVTDIHGRVSNCMSMVEVRDNGIIDDVVIVTRDFQIDCGEDYSEYVPYDGGKTVRFLTRCGIPVVPDYSIDTSGINSCGLGQIVRTYTARDAANNLFTHEHIITVGDPNDLVDPDNIAGFWPINFEGEGCPGSAIYPSNLSSQYVPDFDPADYPCSNADLDHTDLVFHNVEGYCAKVLRTWALIDWCQTKTNDPNAGVWEYVQIFKLTDNQNPVIQANAVEIRTTTNANSCNAFVSLTVTADDCHDDADLRWTYSITDPNGVIASGTSNSFNNSLAVGTYNIAWTVADPCDNGSSFNQTLQVIDGVAPAMACENMTVDIATIGDTPISASDFAGNTNDGGCTATEDLEFYFGSIAGSKIMTINCNTLNGQPSRSMTLTIVALDESGNFSECEVTLNITDNTNMCGFEGATAFIEGGVMTELNYTIDDVKIELKNANDVAMSNAITPIEGTFEFGEVPMYDSYELKASREDDYLNGVTTLDLLLIQRHILGLRLLNSPYKVIAADIDGSASVSAGDLVGLRKLILGTTYDLPIKRSWTFVDAAQTFANNLTPFPYRQILQVENLKDNMKDLNFIGVKMGDVNENVFLESAALAGSRSISTMTAQMSKIDNKTAVITIDPNAAISLGGLQSAIQINPEYAQIISVTSSVLDLSAENYVISDNGLIKLSWTAPKALSIEKESHGLIEIVVSIKSELPELDEIISINNESLTSEIYSYSGEDLEVSDIKLEYSKIREFDVFKLNQNSPNPFISETTIQFYNNIDSEVKLTVFDVSGKQLYSEKNFYQKGDHQINITSDMLEGAGMYIYEMNNGTEIVRKKMMALE